MQRLFRVQEKDYKEALADEHYTIVICAWMPFGADWTSDIRKKVRPQPLIRNRGRTLRHDWHFCRSTLVTRMCLPRSCPCRAQQASVLEYILIGHTGDGLNGDPLRTWGYRKHHYDPDDDGGDDDDEGVHKEGYLPPEEREHVKDGFDRVDLPHLSKWQLCRFDNVDACSGQVVVPSHSSHF